LRRASAFLHLFVGLAVCCSVFLFKANSAFACDPPDVLIVLDRSCSMGSNSKWTQAKNAIRTITNNYKGKLRFGLETFNSGAAINYALTKCQSDGVATNCVPRLQTTLNSISYSGGTNLIAALTVAKNHLNAVKAADTVSGRKRSVMFLTDGQATCAFSEARALWLQLGVKTYVIGFGSGVDGNCLSKMATEGQTALSGTRKYYQANSQTELNAAMKAIADASRVEICNNSDDDCDGRVDEGLSRACSGACGAGTQVCSKGAWGTCSTAPKAETCNGRDDDCDGATDENWPQKSQGCSVGVGACRRNGTYVCNSAKNGVVCSAKAGSASSELCDGIDNDCDGRVDENWPQKGSSCFAGTGACRNTGTFSCNSAKTGLTCSAKAGSPTTEKCNGQDDDCDGKIDESLTRTCSSKCGSGQETCQGGTWVNCTAKTPSPELCNGKDDDCDGSIDEDWSLKNKTCTVGKGICARSSKWRCRADQFDIECPVKAGSPTTEICNGKDDDCDGLTDENWPQKGEPCVGGTGACQRTGKKVCSGDGKSLICSATQGNATKEICNDKDDDCDGKVDEDWALKGKFCSVGLGECRRTGSWICNTAGTNVACSVKAGKAGTETCNGKDDDCDGLVDEQLEKACTTGCGKGKQVCINGKFAACSSPVPSPEKCDGIDNDCNGQVDDQWPNRGKNCSVGKGACKRVGRWICDASKTKLQCSAKAGSPTTEVCDDKDNDCDGQIDENWANKGKTCGSGVGGCQRKGTYVCKPDGTGTQCSVSGTVPEPEKCDGIDNDCNGQVDENVTRACKTKCGVGLETCKGGKFEGCTARQPTAETCNGRDDNCDGSVDENLTQECSTKCGKGQEQCVNGKWEFCDAQKSVAEECNGKDDDCDGDIDEDVAPKPCKGSCGSGTAVCADGKFGGCSGPQPEPEKCDGKDNDCNGKVDDNLEQNCRSACGSGKQTCVNGAWSDCSAPTPQPEFCNGKDDDCDGQVDNSATCPSGLECKDGLCRPLCVGGECAKGLLCVDGFCVGDPCKDRTCASDEVCIGGKCVEPCTLISCNAGFICSNGQCVKEDCYIKGCPSGESCENGLCVADPCAGKTCGAGEFCREGDCVKSCASVTCQDNQKCVDGKCEDDPTKNGDCASVFCKDGEFCKEGKCVVDPCAGVFCGKGRICKEGRCTHDTCTNITCPTGAVCKDGQCQKDNTGGDPDGTTNADGGINYPDGWSYSPDEGTVTLPDGRVVPADQVSRQPDGKIVVNGPDKANEYFIPDNKTTGTGVDKKPTGRTVEPGGCGCQTTSGFPVAPVSLLIFFLFIGLRRREQ